MFSEQTDIIVTHHILPCTHTLSHTNTPNLSHYLTHKYTYPHTLSYILFRFRMVLQTITKAKETHLKRALETISRLKTQLGEVQGHTQETNQGNTIHHISTHLVTISLIVNTILVVLRHEGMKQMGHNHNLFYSHHSNTDCFTQTNIHTIYPHFFSTTHPLVLLNRGTE